ncbi:MAG: Ig-like domain-containing protein [Micromonosporaceae bacterium]
MAVAALAAVSLVAMSSPASAQPEPSQTTVTASPGSAVLRQQVILTATVTCRGFTPGGLGVTFFDASDLLDTVPVGPRGEASITTTFSTVGSHVITAAYNGDSNCGASFDTTAVEVSLPGYATRM